MGVDFSTLKGKGRSEPSSFPDDATLKKINKAAVANLRNWNKNANKLDRIFGPQILAAIEFREFDLACYLLRQITPLSKAIEKRLEQGGLKADRVHVAAAEGGHRRESESKT